LLYIKYCAINQPMKIPETPKEGAAKSWNEFLGPFWATSQVSRLLDLTDEEVRKRYEERRLLGCKTQDGSILFPTFQFVQNEQDQSWHLIEGLDTVVSVFAGIKSHHVDWTLASWIRARRSDLEGESIIDYLKAGKGLEIPLVIARDAANRWSH